MIVSILSTYYKYNMYSYNNKQVRSKITSINVNFIKINLNQHTQSEKREQIEVLFTKSKLIDDNSILL